MKLRRTTILAGIENALREKILPLIDDDFARNEVHLAATLVSVERDERDTMAALLVEEHERLRALFAQAAGIIGETALKVRLDNAAGGRTGTGAIAPPSGGWPLTSGGSTGVP